MTATAPLRRLEGRRAFVSGAASGIGLATVRRLLAEGARVVLTDARRAALDEACAGLEPTPHALTCDVGSEEEVLRAMSAAIEFLGGLDILVSCAGILRSEPTHAISLEQTR